MIFLILGRSPFTIEHKIIPRRKFMYEMVVSSRIIYVIGVYKKLIGEIIF